MNKYLIPFLALILTAGTPVSAQQPDAEGSLVKWMSLKDALAKNDSLPKPILLDFYTSWCGWCKKMMKTTYADAGLAQYINQFFYPAKFDAEGKDTLVYLGKKYGPSSLAPRTPHEFTKKMLKDQLMYPATLFLNNYDKTKQEFGVSMVASGYLEQQKIEPLLVFNVEQVFRTSSYDNFGAAFQKAFYDSTLNDKLKKLKWMPVQEVFSAPVPKKKKTLVFIYTDWCNSCKVMQRTSFSDSLVSIYLGEHFELAEMNAQDTVTLKFKDRIFINARTPQEPFHQLAKALCRNNMILPSLAILDENMNLLDAVAFYIDPKFLDDILHYYGENVYKTTSWKDYMTAKQEIFQGKGALAPKK